MLNDLGVILWNRGKLREATEAYRAALAIKEKRLNPPNQKLAGAHNNLSLLLLDLGDFAQGEEQARQALSAYRELFGENHPDVGMALHNHAKLLRELARLDEAERAIRDAIEVYKRVYQGDHDYHAEALDDLGLILEKKGDAKGSEAAFRTGLAMGRRTVGDDHPQTLHAMRHLALVLSRGAATLSEAEELMSRSIAASRRKFAKQPAALASCLDDLATFLVNTARPKEAEPVLLEAYQLQANGNQSSRPLKKICGGLVQLYGILGQPDLAQKWAAKLVELGQ